MCLKYGSTVHRNGTESGRACLPRNPFGSYPEATYQGWVPSRGIPVPSTVWLQILTGGFVHVLRLPAPRSLHGLIDPSNHTWLWSIVKLVVRVPDIMSTLKPILSSRNVYLEM